MNEYTCTIDVLVYSAGISMVKISVIIVPMTKDFWIFMGHRRQIPAKPYRARTEQCKYMYIIFPLSCISQSLGRVHMHAVS